MTYSLSSMSDGIGHAETHNLVVVFVVLFVYLFFSGNLEYPHQHLLLNVHHKTVHMFFKSHFSTGPSYSLPSLYLALITC